MTENAKGYQFVNGVVIPPAPEPTHEAHRFDPAADEPQHVYDHKVSHAPYAHVMETLVRPVSAHFQYQPGMFVYVHKTAASENPVDALECCIEDVTDAPLRILVTPCNHPELTHYVRQDQLSAPIWV